MMRATSILLGIALLVSSAAAGQAEDQASLCTLNQLASLEMKTELSGLVSVPVTIDGIDGWWMVDTGNVRSMISSSLVGHDALKRIPAYGGTMLGGVEISELAITQSVQFAGRRMPGAVLAIVPEQAIENNTLGILAPDVLRQFDADFDFARARLNLISPHHCREQVVYWTKGDYARIPITVDRVGHMTVPVTLDGHSLIAAIDTGSQNSAMSLSVARANFHIAAADPQLRNLGAIRINGVARTAVYRYPFKSLTFGGVQVLNPNISILGETGVGDHGPDILIGIETLHQLHMYIAYREGAMYVTPAEAR